MDPELRVRDELQKGKMKYYADRKSTIKECNIKKGDMVLIRQNRSRKRMPYYDPVAYEVVNRKGNMITAERRGHKVTRNSSFFKKVPDDDDELSSDELPPEIDNNISSIPTDEGRSQPSNTNGGLRRSSRVTGAPVRFPMDVPY